MAIRSASYRSRYRFRKQYSDRSGGESCGRLRMVKAEWSMICNRPQPSKACGGGQHDSDHAILVIEHSH
jgi:hypothetical protein